MDPNRQYAQQQYQQGGGGQQGYYQQYPSYQQPQAQHYGNNGQQYDPNGLARQLQNQHLGSNSPQSQGQGRPKTPGQQSLQTPNTDYVYFERNVENFSNSTRERAAAAKMKMELYYQNNVQHAVERNQR